MPTSYATESALAPSSSAPDRLLTRNDVAQILGVSLKSITKIQTGRFAGRPALRPIIKTAHITRFRASDLEQWLLSGVERPVRQSRGRPKKYRRNPEVKPNALQSFL